jgi:DNA-binding protein H-NS
MPNQTDTPVELSLDEIHEQLAKVEAEKKALELALEERRVMELEEFANAIREQIADRGYTIDQVLALLTKGRRKAASGRRPTGYARYVDPDNPERGYSRGPLPAWLREKMEEQGYDPADKAQREEFKANYLKQVA